MSVYIGEHIANTLLSDDLVRDKVGGRVYPVTYAKGIEDKLVYPYIVYARDGLQVDEDKTGEDGEQTTASLIVAAKKYEELLAVSGAVRDALLRNAQGHYERFDVLDFTYNIGPEQYDYAEGCYFAEFSLTYITE